MKRSKPKPVAKKPQKEKTYTPQTAWIKNRLRERGVSLDAAAGKLESYKLMLHRIVSGTRPARPDEILALGELLGISAIEALRRFGYDVPETKVDIIGRVNEFGRLEFLPPDLVRKTEAPSDAMADTRAITVDAPHSRLSLYDGATLFYTPSTVVDAQAVGRLAVIEAGDQPLPVIGVLTYAAGGKKRVTIIGGGEIIETRQLISAAPITWIRAV